MLSAIIQNRPVLFGLGCIAIGWAAFGVVLMISFAGVRR